MRLFYDDEFDAINAAIADSGKTFKEVANYMFPDLKPESAYSRLKVCCNSTGDQRLTFGQVVRLMNFCGCYDPLMYACDETMHSRPDRRAPEDEEVRLVEAINMAASNLNKAMTALDRIQSNPLRNQLKAVAK